MFKLFLVGIFLTSSLSFANEAIIDKSWNAFGKCELTKSQVSCSGIETMSNVKIDISGGSQIETTRYSIWVLKNTELVEFSLDPRYPQKGFNQRRVIYGVTRLTTLPNGGVCYLLSKKASCEDLNGEKFEFNNPTQISTDGQFAYVVDGERVKYFRTSITSSLRHDPLQISFLNGVKRISTAGLHGCVITDTGLKCWENQYWKQVLNEIEVPQYTNMNGIYVGLYHACTLYKKTQVSCFSLLRANTEVYSFKFSEAPIWIKPSGFDSWCANTKNQGIKCWAIGSNAADIPDQAGPYED